MIKKIKAELKSERFTLKQLKPNLELAKEIFLVTDANRSHLEAFLPWVELTKQPEHSMIFLLESEADFKAGKKVAYGVYIDDKYAGNIGVFDISEDNKSAEIGYWLSSEYARKGYMSEVLGVVEKELFQNIGINRIQIQCDQENIASLGVAKKCHYKLEGTLRDNYFSKYFNEFRNTLVFSKLKSEFEAE